MILLLGFAFVAGVLTILAPCTLPVVPLVLGASATGGRDRTVGILIGFGVAFLGAAIVFTSALAALGLDTGAVRLASGLVLGLVGLSLVSVRFARQVERTLAPIADMSARLVGRRQGLAGGLVLGGAIGLLWAPCVGPIMAGVLVVAAQRGPTAESVLIALAYVVGAAVPLALIAVGGRRIRDRIGSVVRRGRLQQGLGAAMLLSAVLVTSGLDLVVQDGVSRVLPAGWTQALLAVEPAPGSPASVDGSRVGAAASATASLPSAASLPDLGLAPEPTGIQAWINAQPQTMRSLRGKVVLLEFWTFACINCIHVQPHLNAWFERYADAGLVVLGVHSPEFSFERDIENVRSAVVKAGIHYPVALDPSFATWNAYGNGAWPALYFIDRAGHIRHTHGGEGDYDGSEQVIRQLLAEAG